MGLMGVVGFCWVWSLYGRERDGFPLFEWSELDVCQGLDRIHPIFRGSGDDQGFQEMPTSVG